MRALSMVATACALLLAASGGAAAPPKSASVLLIWRVDAPQAASADVQAAEAGLIGLNFIAPMLTALARHPRAKMTLALDPAFLHALADAAAGRDAFPALASGALAVTDARADQLRAVITADVVPVTGLRASKAAGRFISEAVAARLALMGSGTARRSHAGDVDYAATALLLSLSAGGYARDPSKLLAADGLSAPELGALAKDFAGACRDVIERLRRASAAKTVELAALPAYEPILPLVIDAAGRSLRVPFTVAFSGEPDAAEAVDEGVRAVTAIDPSQGKPGMVSPSGAYDDSTAAMLQAHGLRYAVFSERVLEANVGAAPSSVEQAHGAPFRAYLMEISKTQTLPIFFCADTASTSIDSQPLGSPPSAMADRMSTVVAAALATASDERTPVVTLCLPAAGSILHRANRAQALDALAAALSSEQHRGVTPREFLSAHPPTAATYGYEAASEAGDFNLWMGSQNQMSLWNALLDARAAAGGDAAVASARVRDVLLQAESGRWFLALALPQPRYLTDESLAQFRALIAQLYRAANKPVPADIAPVKFSQSPPPTPGPPAPPAIQPAASPAALPSGPASPRASPAAAPGNTQR
jgi:hypothetical protein